jgi:hypothetical protein
MSGPAGRGVDAGVYRAIVVCFRGVTGTQIIWWADRNPSRLACCPPAASPTFAAPLAWAVQTRRRETSLHSAPKLHHAHSPSSRARYEETDSLTEAGPSTLHGRARPQHNKRVLNSNQDNDDISMSSETKTDEHRPSNELSSRLPTAKPTDLPMCFGPGHYCNLRCNSFPPPRFTRLPKSNN